MYLDYELRVGTELLLSSHHYPNYYLKDSYVLWTLAYPDDMDNTDIVFQILFGYVRLDTNDYLRIGYGWDPGNATLQVRSVGPVHGGTERDVFLTAGKVYIEFDANAPREDPGFQLRFVVRNISGTYLIFLRCKNDLYI